MSPKIQENTKTDTHSIDSTLVKEWVPSALDLDDMKKQAEELKQALAAYSVNESKTVD